MHLELRRNNIKIAMTDACSILEKIAIGCADRRAALEFKCEGCPMLDLCAGFDGNEGEPWEWLEASELDRVTAAAENKKSDRRHVFHTRI